MQVKFTPDHGAITAMNSMEGEAVDLAGAVHVTETIEQWLADLAKWVMAARKMDTAVCSMQTVLEACSDTQVPCCTRHNFLP